MKKAVWRSRVGRACEWWCWLVNAVSPTRKWWELRVMALIVVGQKGLFLLDQLRFGLLRACFLDLVEKKTF